MRLVVILALVVLTGCFHPPRVLSGDHNFREPLSQIQPLRIDLEGGPGLGQDEAALKKTVCHLIDAFHPHWSLQDFEFKKAQKDGASYAYHLIVKERKVGTFRAWSLPDRTLVSVTGVYPW